MIERKIVLWIENSKSNKYIYDGERKDRNGKGKGSETKGDRSGSRKNERYKYKYINIKKNMRKV